MSNVFLLCDNRQYLRQYSVLPFIYPSAMIRKTQLLLVNPTSPLQARCIAETDNHSVFNMLASSIIPDYHYLNLKLHNHAPHALEPSPNVGLVARDAYPIQIFDAKEPTMPTVLMNQDLKLFSLVWPAMNSIWLVNSSHDTLGKDLVPYTRTISPSMADISRNLLLSLTN